MKRFRERVKSPTTKNPELIAVGKKQTVPQIVKAGPQAEKRMKTNLTKNPVKPPTKGKKLPSKGR